MGSAPFARLVSLLSTSFGALMLVAPDQFGASQYVVLRPHLVLWGAVFLTAGLALLAATVLDIRGWRQVCLLVGNGGMLIAVGLGFGLAGAWTALAVHLTLGLATLLVAATPGRRAGTGGRRELLEIVIGASTLMLGVSALLTEPVGGQSVGLLGDNLRWYGLVLAVGGGLLLLSEVGGLTSSRLARVSRLGTATGLMLYVGLSSFPQRAWTDVLVYAGFGLALAVQPRIDPRFQRVDAASLRIRLALVLCIAATLPLVVLFVVDAKRDELAVARLNLSLEQSLAEALARDVLRDVRAYEAEARAGAALPDLANVPADNQAALLTIETDRLANSLSSVEAGGRIYFAGTTGVTSSQLQEAIDGPIGSGAVTYSDQGQDWLAGFARVPNIHQVIVVDRPAALALAEVRGGREVVFGLLLACAALAVAAGVIMAGQLDKPLRMLAAAAARFGDGDITVGLPRSPIPEVALLASNFATMRDTLATRTADLKRAEFDARRAESGLRELNQFLEQRVTERTTELERVSKHKSDFLTSMSHELRTPLNAIIGFSEIMLDHDVVEIPNEQRKTYLDHIQRSGHHLLGLVNDILDLAKVESGHMDLSLERMPLQAALVGCVDVIRSMSDPKLLTVVTRCEPPDALVTADPARLKQILYNLLSNAVKFTPTGGQISVSARVNAIEALIAIHDTGIGIRPEDQELIFEPFQQAKAAGPPKQEGTGLGLPLVRELVELHGGRVWLDSTPDVGSCFSFTLPHGLNRLPEKDAARGPEALAISAR